MGDEDFLPGAEKVSKYGRQANGLPPVFAFVGSLTIR